MQVSDTIRARKTVRGYKPDPVPEALIRDILDTARYSASNCNTQPWHISVISGDARKRLEDALVTEIISGKAPTPVFSPGDAGLTGVYKERQFDCAMRYYSTMDIAREEKDKRNALMLKNWQFFDAPHVGIISMPSTMGPINAIDVGIYLQSLMLLFVENGLASCPQGALAFYTDPIFDIADIPEGNAIVCGISFGYEDPDAKINEVKMPRAPLADTASFIS